MGYTEYIGSQLVATIQTAFGSSDPVQTAFRLLSDLNTGYMQLQFILPLSLLLSHWAAFSLATAISFASASCIILKWSLSGHRPYWYSDGTADLSTLRQFAETCEITPGCPACRSMIATATAIVIAVNVLRHHKSASRTLVFTLCLAYTLFSALSELYLARHFLHQVAIGVSLGSFGGIIICVLPWPRSRSMQFVGAMLFFVGWDVCTQHTLTALGGEKHIIDKRELALAACEREDWVGAFPLPSARLWHAMGAILGIACSLALKSERDTPSAEQAANSLTSPNLHASPGSGQSERSTVRYASCALAIVLVQVATRLCSGHMKDYSLHRQAFTGALTTFLSLCVAPGIVNRLLRSSKEHSN